RSAGVEKEVAVVHAVALIGGGIAGIAEGIGARPQGLVVVWREVGKAHEYGGCPVDQRRLTALLLHGVGERREAVGQTIFAQQILDVAVVQILVAAFHRGEDSVFDQNANDEN